MPPHRQRWWIFGPACPSPRPVAETRCGTSAWCRTSSAAASCMRWCCFALSSTCALTSRMGLEDPGGIWPEQNPLAARSPHLPLLLLCQALLLPMKSPRLVARLRMKISCQTPALQRTKSLVHIFWTGWRKVIENSLLGRGAWNRIFFGVGAVNGVFFTGSGWQDSTIATVFLPTETGARFAEPCLEPCWASSRPVRFWISVLNHDSKQTK